MFRRVLAGGMVAAVFLGIGSSARAATGFSSEAEFPLTVSGTQLTTVTVSVQGSTMTCKTIGLSGTLSEATESLSVAPSFSECKAFGFLSSSVAVNGCRFDLHPGTEASTTEFSGSTDIDCESGKSITITAATCKVTIGKQSGLGTVEFADQSGPPEKVNAGFELSKMALSVTSGFLCPLETGESIGSLEGTIGIEAVNGAQQGIKVGKASIAMVESPVENMAAGTPRNVTVENNGNIAWTVKSAAVEKPADFEIVAAGSTCAVNQVIRPTHGCVVQVKCKVTPANGELKFGYSLGLMIDLLRCNH